ncbi:MAG: hypothetical protein ABJA37_10650 [Ferruginibacter sp.]
MKIIIVNIISLLLAGNCFCQSIKLKGQLFCNNIAVKNYTILINDKPVTSDFSGAFSASLPASTTQVTLHLQDKRYVLLYPAAGRLLIPKDNSLVTEIIFGSFGADPYLKQYTNLLKQIKDAKATGIDINPLLQRLDSVEAYLKKLHYTTDELMSSRDRQNGIDLFFPEITTTLRNYLSQANEVKNAFKYTADFALTQQTALTVLVQAINSYNPVIEKLYLTQSTNSKKILDYWQDSSLQKTFDGITDTIINEITKKTVTKLNDIKNRINLFYQNKLPGNRQQNQEMIRQEIAAILPVFTRQLDDLETRINFLNARLADY